MILPIRYNVGAARTGSDRQAKHQDALHVAHDMPGQTRKRDGSVEVDLSTSTDDLDQIDVIAYRDDELVAEMDDRLWSRRTCVDSDGGSIAGTATPAEIAAIKSAIADIPDDDDVQIITAGPRTDLDPNDASAIAQHRLVYAGMRDTYTSIPTATRRIKATKISSLSTQFDLQDVNGVTLSSAIYDRGIAGPPIAQIVVSISADNTQGLALVGYGGTGTDDMSDVDYVRLSIVSDTIDVVNVGRTTFGVIFGSMYSRDGNVAWHITSDRVYYIVAEPGVLPLRAFGPRTLPASSGICVWVEGDVVDEGSYNNLDVYYSRIAGSTLRVYEESSPDIARSPTYPASSVNVKTGHMMVYSNGAYFVGIRRISHADVCIRASNISTNNAIVSTFGSNIYARVFVSGTKSYIQYRNDDNVSYWPTREIQSGSPDYVGIHRTQRGVRYMSQSPTSQVTGVDNISILGPVPTSIPRGTSKLTTVGNGDINTTLYASSTTLYSYSDNVSNGNTSSQSWSINQTSPAGTRLGAYTLDVQTSAQVAIRLAQPFGLKSIEIATYPRVGSPIIDQVEDGIAQIISAVILPFPGPRALVGTIYASGEEIYESVPPSTWIRVDPPSIGISGGTWVDRGPWTRRRLRERSDYIDTQVIKSAGCVDFGDCRATLAESNNGLRLIISGETGREVNLLLANAGDTTESMIGPIDPVRKDVCISYIDNVDGVDTYEFFIYDVGATAPTGPFTALASGGGFDAHASWYSRDLGDVGIAVWGASRDATTFQLRHRRSNIPPGAGGGLLGSSITHAHTSVGTVRECDVVVDPIEKSPGIYDMWWIVVGSTDTVTGRVELDIINNTITAISTRSHGVVSSTASAVSLIAYDGSLYSAIETFGTTTLYQMSHSTGVTTTLRTLSRTQIASNWAWIGDYPVIALIDTTDELNSNASYLWSPLARGVIAPVVGEYVARGSIFAASTGRVGFQVPKSHLSYTDTHLAWAIPGRPQPQDESQLSVRSHTLDLRRYNAVHPSVDGSLVSAHAGYPRTYDGDQVYEHDFHQLPKIVTATNTTGLMTQGATYLIGGQYEWTDAQGHVHRSSMDLRTVTLSGSNDAIQIQSHGVEYSECENLKFVIWRSVANDTTLLYREAETIAYNVATVTLTATLSDSQISNGDYEAVSTELLFSDPAPVTDWLAFSSDRIWGPDPRDLSRVSYSSYGYEWPSGFTLELDRPIKSIAEQDGRVIAITESTISQITGGGPSDTGVGDYAPPVEIPVDIGTSDHSTVTTTPLGIFFASDRGLRLLDRGLQVRDLGDLESKTFSDLSQITNCRYAPQRGEVIVCYSDETWRWHAQSDRWARCANIVTSITSDRTGNQAKLIDGRVVIDDSSITYNPYISAHRYLTPDRIYVASSDIDLEMNTSYTRNGTITDVSPVLHAWGPSIFALDGISGTNIAIPEISTNMDGIIAVIDMQSSGTLFDQHHSVSGAGIVCIYNGTNVVCTITYDDLTTDVLSLPTSLGLHVISIYIDADNIRLDVDDQTTSTPKNGVITTDSDMIIGDDLACNIYTVMTSTVIPEDSMDDIRIYTTSPDTIKMRVCADGSLGYTCRSRSPWMRLNLDPAVSRGFNMTAIEIYGTYEGRHDLTISVYGDFDDTTPTATYRVGANDIDQNYMAGREYHWRCTHNGPTYGAVMIEISDGAEKNSTYRLDAIDLHVTDTGGDSYRLSTLQEIPEIS